jgi:hypothetical protein
MRSKNPGGGQTATPSIALQPSNPRNSRKQNSKKKHGKEEQAQKNQQRGKVKKRIRSVYL